MICVPKWVASLALFSDASFVFHAGPSSAPLAACVFGAHHPSTESTTYMDLALPFPCTPCTWTMGLQESLFTVAELFANDWLSVWSLNVGNPDKDQSGTSVYYAHPYQLLQAIYLAAVVPA